MALKAQVTCGLVFPLGENAALVASYHSNMTVLIPTGYEVRIHPTLQTSVHVEDDMALEFVGDKATLAAIEIDADFHQITVRPPTQAWLAAQTVTLYQSADKTGTQAQATEQLTKFISNLPEDGEAMKVVQAFVEVDYETVSKLFKISFNSLLSQLSKTNWEKVSSEVNAAWKDTKPDLSAILTKTTA
jgi:hypothetical protein